VCYPLLLDSNAYKILVVNSETNQESLAYPSYQYELNSSFVMISLAFSIGGSSPLLLDYIYDKMFMQNLSPSHLDTYLASIRRIALFVISLDVVYMVILIPFEQFNILLTLLVFRDILYTFEFLKCLNQLFPEVFNIWLVLGTSWSFALANHLELQMLLSTDSEALSTVFTMFVVVGFLLLLALYGRWIYFIVHNTDTSLRSKILLCNVYSGTFFLFICGDWGSCLAPVSLQDDMMWYSLLGSNFFVMYEYLITINVICATMMVSRLAKKESDELEVQIFQ